MSRKRIFMQGPCIKRVHHVHLLLFAIPNLPIQLYAYCKKTRIKADCVVIDEAGQLGLGPASLVLKSLENKGRVIIAGDSEQLAPILTTQYPQVESRLFGSILDCLMHFSQHSKKTNEGVLRPPSPALTESSDGDFPSSQSTVVQLTENFRCV